VLKVTEIKDNSGFEHSFIAILGNEVVGKATLYIDKAKKEAEFRIHLVDKFQSKGHGEVLSRIAVNHGMMYLDRIWLGVEATNTRAKNLYEKLGFRYTTHQMEIT